MAACVNLTYMQVDCATMQRLRAVYEHSFIKGSLCYQGFFTPMLPIMNQVVGIHGAKPRVYTMRVALQGLEVQSSFASRGSVIFQLQAYEIMRMAVQHTHGYWPAELCTICILTNSIFMLTMINDVLVNGK